MAAPQLTLEGATAPRTRHLFGYGHGGVSAAGATGMQQIEAGGVAKIPTRHCSGPHAKGSSSPNNNGAPKDTPSTRPVPP